MKERRLVDAFSILGLLLGFISAVDLLGYWNSAVLRGVYLIYMGAALLGVGLVLASRRARTVFVELCKMKSWGIGLRFILAILVFLINWYVTEAMGVHFGENSAYVANTGVHMILAVSVLLSHLTYFGFVQRVKTGPETPSFIERLHK